MPVNFGRTGRWLWCVIGASWSWTKHRGRAVEFQGATAADGGHRRSVRDTASASIAKTRRLLAEAQRGAMRAAAAPPRSSGGGGGVKRGTGRGGGRGGVRDEGKARASRGERSRFSCSRARRRAPPRGPRPWRAARAARRGRAGSAAAQTPASAQHAAEGRSRPRPRHGPRRATAEVRGRGRRSPPPRGRPVGYERTEGVTLSAISATPTRRVDREGHKHRPVGMHRMDIES